MLKKSTGKVQNYPQTIRDQKPKCISIKSTQIISTKKNVKQKHVF